MFEDRSLKFDFGMVLKGLNIEHLKSCNRDLIMDIKKFWADVLFNPFRIVVTR